MTFIINCHYLSITTKKTVAFKKNMLYNTFLMNDYACVAQLARATDS